MSVSIADINLSNDLVFGEVMRQPENVKPFLEAVLEKKIAEITYIEKQQDIKDGIHLHGIRLDVSLADQAGTAFTPQAARIPPRPQGSGGIKGFSQNNALFSLS